MATLREELKKIDKNDTVAIGAASCFLYFGAPDNTDEIELVSYDLYEEAGFDLSDTRTNLKNLPARKDELNVDLVERFHKCVDVCTSDETDAKKKQEIRSIEKAVIEITKKLARCEHLRHFYNRKIRDLVLYRRNFVPLLDREVVNQYRQDASDYAYVLIVAGTESGRYWTQDEYNTGIYEDDTEDMVEEAV